MNNFRELIVWQKAIDLADNVFKISHTFPRSQDYILKAQLLRAVTSVASNIAEGSGRNSKKDFSHFLDISAGSLNEVQTQLIIACNANFISSNDLEVITSKINHISKMLYKLKQSLNVSIKEKSKA